MPLGDGYWQSWTSDYNSYYGTATTSGTLRISNPSTVVLSEPDIDPNPEVTWLRQRVEEMLWRAA